MKRSLVPAACMMALYTVLVAYPAAAQCPNTRMKATISSSITTFACEGTEGTVQCITMVRDYSYLCEAASEETECVDDANAVLQDIWREKCVSGTCVVQPVVVTLTGPGKKTNPCS